MEHNSHLRIQDATIVPHDFYDESDINNSDIHDDDDNKSQSTSSHELTNDNKSKSYDDDDMHMDTTMSNPPDIGDDGDNENINSDHEDDDINKSQLLSSDAAAVTSDNQSKPPDDDGMDMDMDMDMNTGMDRNMDHKENDEATQTGNQSWRHHLQEIYVPMPTLSSDDSEDSDDNDDNTSDDDNSTSCQSPSSTSDWTSDSDSVDENELDLSMRDMANMLELGRLPLYTGSDITVLACVVTLFKAQATFKTKHVILKSQFDIMRWALPSGHNLPTYEISRRMIRYFGGIDVQNIPCCANSQCDFLFYDRPLRHDPNGEWQHASLTSCPRCGDPKNDAHGHPRKVFSWMGINQQLKNRYNTYEHCTLQRL